MEVRTLNLYTHKLDELKTFYTEVLGFVILASAEKKFQLQCGASVLSFTEGIDQAYYHFAFNIPSFQVKSALSWLKKRVAIIKNEEEEIIDFPNWNAEAIYFFDPAGNILEFIARKNLNLRADSPFNIQSIQNISEVGLPVKDVKKAFLQLENDIGLAHYWGDQKFFSAAGDEQGLIILINSLERNWLFTNLNAKSFPLEVALTHKGQSYQLSTDGTRINISS